MSFVAILRVLMSFVAILRVLMSFITILHQHYEHYAGTVTEPCIEPAPHADVQHSGTLHSAFESNRAVSRMYLPSLAQRTV